MKDVRGCNEQDGKSIPTRACYLIQICYAQRDEEEETEKKIFISPGM